MPEIKLSINKCSECPNCKVTRLYTEDSWEHAEDYWCTAVAAKPMNEHGRDNLPYKLIRGYVEWSSEIPAPPEWCPLISEDYKSRLRRETAKEMLLILKSTIKKIEELGGVASPLQEDKLKELQLASMDIKLD